MPAAVAADARDQGIDAVKLSAGTVALTYSGSSATLSKRRRGP